MDINFNDAVLATPVQWIVQLYSQTEGGGYPDRSILTEGCGPEYRQGTQGDTSGATSILLLDHIITNVGLNRSSHYLLVGLYRSYYSHVSVWKDIKLLCLGNKEKNYSFGTCHQSKVSVNGIFTAINTLQSW